jgi:hypothetical protein
MMRRMRLDVTLLYLLAGLLVATLLAPASAGAQSSPPRDERGVVTVANDQIAIMGNEFGQYTIGTRAGDPGTLDDDEKRLMYGFGQRRFTSFTTVRVVAGGQADDVPLLRRGNSEPVEENGGLRTEWQLDEVLITQILAPATNPYTSRPDTVRIALTAKNTSGETLSAGARIMLDTMIGNNDRAPFFVPGAGNFDKEREFLREQMPSYWKSFEAADYDAASLKGQGIVTGGDATVPDRLVFATWPFIKNSAWDYTVDPNMPVGDSAVAMYWEPQELAPGASVTWVTYYGLAGVGGGNAWIDAPVNITSDAPEFDATLWVANLSDADFTGGDAVINLPQGLRLAEGETERKPMADVPVNGGARSASWRLVGGGEVDATYPYSATVTFETGSGPLSADASVEYAFIAPPEPTATASPTITPTETPIAPVIAPVVPPPDEERGFPWWLFLLPLLLLPLLLLLLRRQPARPGSRVAPPRAVRTAPPPDFTERQQEMGPYGASVTHGRKKTDGRDPHENPMA